MGPKKLGAVHCGDKIWQEAEIVTMCIGFQRKHESQHSEGGREKGFLTHPQIFQNHEHNKLSDNHPAKSQS